jgi:hypothetical protein
MKLWTVGPQTNIRRVSPGATFKGSFFWLIVLKSIKLGRIFLVTRGSCLDGERCVYVSLFHQRKSLMSSAGLLGW